MTHGNKNGSEWIRVSCAALCRIEHEGRYLLLVNENRRRRGLYVLSPVGGALSLHDLSVAERWGARLENPEERDLRMLLRHKYLPEFRAWFETGEGRERSPYREVHEEFVIESKLLSAFEPDDMTCRFLRRCEDEGFTQRQGQTGLLTHYFLEIYDVEIVSTPVLQRLLDASPETGALWLTPEQIRAGGYLKIEIDGAVRDVKVRGEAVLPSDDTA